MKISSSATAFARSPLFLVISTAILVLVFSANIRAAAQNNTHDPDQELIEQLKLFKPDIHVFKFLIERGADVNVFGEIGKRVKGFVGTPLHLACGNMNSQIVTLLLKAGADARARDSYGHTPLETLEKVVLPILTPTVGDFSVTLKREATRILLLLKFPLYVAPLFLNSLECMCTSPHWKLPSDVITTILHRLLMSLLLDEEEIIALNSEHSGDLFYFMHKFVSNRCGALPATGADSP